MVNNQPPEKKAHSEDLEIVNMFLTIQGEGPFSGERAIFIRTAGCNLECPACDTDYTSNRVSYSIKQVIEMVHDFCPEITHDGFLVVITGGEPFRQPYAVTEFANTLILEGFRVQFETNGTLEIPPHLSNDATIIVSPKTHSIHRNAERRAAAFKYVLQDGHIMNDGLPTMALAHPVRKYVYRPSFNIPVYITPLDEKDEDANARNRRIVARSAIVAGHTAQLQIHKFLEVE